jgi:hypothetical protein
LTILPAHYVIIIPRPIRFIDTVRPLAASVLLSLLGGCAHVWIDADGNRHVVGLMHLTLSPNQSQAAAETLRVRTLGLAVTRAEAGSAIVFGYSDTTLGFLRNDVCVVPDRAHLETSR